MQLRLQVALQADHTPHPRVLSSSVDRERLRVLNSEFRRRLSGWFVAQCPARSRLWVCVSDGHVGDSEGQGGIHDMVVLTQPLFHLFSAEPKLCYILHEPW